MSDNNKKKALQEEITELENRIRSLPDNQVVERRELREKRIKKRIELKQIITI